MALIDLLILAAAVAQAPGAGEIVAETLDPSTPARTLDCTVSKAVNIDLSKDQRPEDLRYEGNYALAFALPAAADAETGSYVVTKDEAGLFGAPPVKFARVADTWPDRTEMAVGSPAGILFAVIGGIDKTLGRANLTVSRMKQEGGIDPSFLYQGTCRVSSGPAAGSKAQ